MPLTYYWVYYDSLYSHLPHPHFPRCTYLSGGVVLSPRWSSGQLAYVIVYSVEAHVHGAPY